MKCFHYCVVIWIVVIAAFAIGLWGAGLFLFAGYYGVTAVKRVEFEDSEFDSF